MITFLGENNLYLIKLKITYSHNSKLIRSILKPLTIKGGAHFVDF